MTTIHRLALATALALSFAAWPVGGPTDPIATTRSPTVTEQVEGRGLLTTIGCIACIAGAIGIALEGAAAILAAALTEGSTIAVATCVALCKDAVS